MIYNGKTIWKKNCRKCRLKLSESDLTYWLNPHSASKTLRHPSRSCAFLLAFPMSAWVQRIPPLPSPPCQVLSVRPLPCCPWRFHSSAVRAMLPSALLQMWPTHLHFLLLIVFVIGSCWDLCQSFSFDILSGHHNYVDYSSELLVNENVNLLVEVFC